VTPDGLQRLLGALDVAPLGVAPERGFRPSLVGFQRKALVEWRCGLRVSPGEDQPADEHGEDGVAGKHSESVPGRQPA
jgi:hypothetical protein